MKKFIISTVFTVAVAFIFIVSFSMVSGINKSYALQGSHLTGSGKITAKKNSKTKNDENKSKKKLNKMGAGCL